MRPPGYEPGELPTAPPRDVVSLATGVRGISQLRVQRYCFLTIQPNISVFFCGKIVRVGIFPLLCASYPTKIPFLMSNHAFRHAFACLCLVMPSLRCYSQELHPSRNLASPVHWGEGEVLPVFVCPSEEENPSSKGASSAASSEKDLSEKASKGTLHETGLATYYSAKTHGRMMASGERYDKNGFFCAHKTLPFGTKLRVVNTKNGKEVVVTVKDRGPFAKGRIVDLSNKAAEVLGMLSAGVVPVEVWVME